MADFAGAARTFAETWLWKSEPDEDVDGQLLSLEQKLGIHIPANYRKFVIDHGTPATKWLLESIVDGAHALPDIQEFIAIDSVLEVTAMYESGGMDEGHIAFASDCMGNLFLFRVADCTQPSDDAPVYFFDHDFCEIGKINESFGELLAQYLDVEPREG